MEVAAACFPVSKRYENIIVSLPPVADLTDRTVENFNLQNLVF
jgi:hypothetical protein